MCANSQKWYNDQTAQKNYEKGSFIPQAWIKLKI
jgi:hypothetical protein